MKTLQKIVNSFRISPHGITLFTLGIISLADAVDAVLHPRATPLQFLMGCAAGPSLTTTGIVYIITNVGIYHRFIAGMQKHGFSEWHIQDHVQNYCERQAYKAAARALGFEVEFDKANASVLSEQKNYTWLPEV